MMNASSREPAHHGEKNVKKILDAFASPDLAYWFALDFLPGVSDLDLLILHKNAGVFAVEIKAFPIQEILEISLNSIHIRGRGSKKSTNEQAYDALLGLIEFSQRNLASLPFIVATTMWPKISRSVWRAYFRNAPEVAALAESMLFEDDLVSVGMLESRLQRIYRDPPTRKGSSREYRYDQSHIYEINYLLSKDAAAPEPPSCTKFQLIARNQRKSILKKYPLNRTVKVVFEGIPGSGKTYSLLTLAQLHGTEGQSVLLLCFNKALASQLRVNIRSIAEETKDPELVDFVQVLDLFQHASAIAKIFGIEGVTREDYSEWLDLILDELKSQSVDSIGFPDVLLVDEVQDFSPAEIRWVEFWSEGSKWVGIARGVGQEVYSDPDQNERLKWLLKFKAEPLTTNYRNPGRLFLLSKIINIAKLDPTNISSSEPELRKLLSQREIIVNRPEETGLALRVVDDHDDSVLVAEYKMAIKDALAFLSDYKKDPFELLVLIRGSADRRRVQQAATELTGESDVQFLDLTENANRRLVPRANQVRLCTFDSSRGLEADFVLIIGFEQLITGELKDANLALIALSRAVTRCELILKKERSSQLPQVIDLFFKGVERLINAL